jgi:cytochrome c-type biogenesis protein
MIISYTLSFLAGLISFISPCVLPLIPAYISYIVGTTFNEIKTKSKLVVLKNSLLFVFGFSLVFIILGTGATTLGTALINNLNIFTKVMGTFIIIFGFVMAEIIRIPFLERNINFLNSNIKGGFLSPLLLGLAFGFGWTPCIGPILGSILAFAALEDTIEKGILLLTTYSLGLSIPFIVSALMVNQFLKISKILQKYIVRIKKISGYILMFTGILIITGKLQWIGFYLLKIFPIFQKLG